MLLTKRFPFWDLERTLDEMNRMLDLFAGPLSLRSVPAGTFPPINVYDASDKLVVTAELPGVEPKDLELTVVENSLTLSGKRQTEPAGNGEPNYYRRERFNGEFSRTITLPEKINPDAAAAKFANGILTIELPKAQEAKPRSIAVKAG